jgi:hypothetical protein
MPEQIWSEHAALHRQRAQVWTLPTLERRSRGIAHPVEDFLFAYYPYALGKLEQWHPGFGRALQFAQEARPHWLRKYYRCESDVMFCDPFLLSDKEKARLLWTRELLINTSRQAGNFGCFGMHEWAMVYRSNEIRHSGVTGLRMGGEELNRFVESRPIRCSHYDAFRFFTPAAAPLNQLQPDLDGRLFNEQPGCIHANMDLYKWASKCQVWLPGELLLDCFALAMDLRSLDMRASPYDLEKFGYEAVRIETVEGRRQYEVEQRSLADKAAILRERIIAVLDQVVAECSG